MSKRRKRNNNILTVLLSAIIISLGGFWSLGDKDSISNFLKDAGISIGEVQEIDNKEVSELLKLVQIEEPFEMEYNRSEYTSSTQKYEYNGKSYNSIRKYAYDASVHYEDDIYVDPYNGIVLDISSIDYDHIVPLHYANLHGAESWTPEKKKEFADDPSVGVNVSSSSNRQKGDKGPSKWLPEFNKAAYCYTWLVISEKWDLSVSEEDMNTIKDILSKAPDQDIFLINEYKK